MRGGGFTLECIDYFVFYDKPFLKFERLLETYLTIAPKGFSSFIRAIPIWLKEKLFLKETLTRELLQLYKELYPQKSKQQMKAFKSKVFDSLRFSEHHFSHASGAFYPSPFKESAILTIDGVGEWSTTSIAKGQDKSITLLKELHFPHSLGLLYSAFTDYIGFKVNSGEYKVMGLAPYGEPKYTELIKQELIDLRPDGSFRLNMKYFSYTYGLKMTNKHFDTLFQAKRQREGKLEQVHMDLAASIQAVTEEVMLSLSRTALQLTDSKNLALSGGVALNCVGNGKIYKALKSEGLLENIWIQPASGDAGSAIGCALGFYYWHSNTQESYTKTPQASQQDSMKGSYLGLSYSNDEVKAVLDSLNAVYEKLDFSEILERTAKALSEGKVVGWHQGRCEFGPRALGARSILGDARNTTMQRQMNLKIKYRESFRPFAPSVLDSHLSEYFELDIASPYMLLVAPVAKSKRIPMTKDEQMLFGIDKLNCTRSEIPSVTHVDYSARIQSVHKESNPRYYELLQAFFELTGSPVLINTSFNVRGEPIVCSPKDSFSCFMGCEMDVLVIEDFILYKDKQENVDFYRCTKDKYELD
ncbi:MAG: carbamoyltransferase N-terminal domain-containing protein [Helicobacter sp.]|nr:carbamoyltransferase N-terminal domain-containing protein [Helicobacter sp.]MDY5740706.1 carbamoyltransferase N-terminal domain-containing protein [Helicobacter sp.]